MTKINFLNKNNQRFNSIKDLLRYKRSIRVYLDNGTHTPSLTHVIDPYLTRFGVKSSLNFIKEEPIKDLTRYGVESNPGPSLPIIDENIPYLQYGMYTYCYTCCNIEYICYLETSVLITKSSCDLCFYESQSLLSETANMDILGRIDNVKSWLYNGQYHGKSFIGHYVNIPSYLSEHVSLLEDVCLLIHQFINSNNCIDRYLSIVSFCKMRGSRIGFTQLLIYVASELFGSVQLGNDPLHSEIMTRLDYEAQDEEDNMFSDIRKYLNMYDKMKETPIYKKLYKFVLYILSLGLLDSVNIDFNSLNFSKFEAEAIKRTHRPGFDMVHHILDTICFVCERGLQFFKTGDIEVLVHSGGNYEKWVSRSLDLIKQSSYLNNPEPHGINRFEFLSNLKDSIEKGSAIIKFTAGLDKYEKMFVQKTLSDLKLIESDLLTKRAAQMPRRDPFAVLIHGSSSICKSQLKQILFYHYGKVFKMPVSPEYMYTRCPADEYWSGFNSTQWCGVMDDIAFLRPNGDVDPTLMEMLQVKNSVPYTPPQAALEDKGRTPVNFHLLIGTTNTKHLNLHAYFACPFAIARRLSYVITAKVKPEFSKNNFMADSHKIPITPEGEYMNIWNFEISVPVPASDEEMDSQQTKYQIIHTFTDINDMLVWYIGVAQEHEVAQNKALNADNTMMNVNVCEQCYRSTKYCSCFVQQEEQFRELDLSYINDVNKVQLWLCRNIIEGKINEYPLLEYIDYSYDNKNLQFLFVFLLLLSIINFKIYGILSILLFSLFFFYIYFWVVLRYIFQYCGGFLWKYNLLKRICSDHVSLHRLLFQMAGNRVRNIYFTNRILTGLVSLLSLPVFIILIRKCVSSYTLSGKTKMKEQSNIGTIPSPLDVEKPTFYYQDPYVLSDYDISGASKCSQGDILEKQLIHNTAKFIFHFDTQEAGKFVATIAVNIHGNIWMFNKHSVKGDSGTLKVIFDDEAQNVSRNIGNIKISEGDIRTVTSLDLAFIEIRAIPPGYNLVKYFPNDKILSGIYSGKYNLITKSGVRYSTSIVNINKGICPVFQVPGYHGKTVDLTSKGDCGAICLADIGGSKVLLGSHTCGNAVGKIFFQHISQKMLNQVLSTYVTQVECGDIPISAPGYERSLVNLHPKSTLRFLEKGTAQIMGSFTGYRPKHKSKVKKTYICDYVLNNGYKDVCGPPDMSWRPWHLAISDMTVPNIVFKNSDLQLCEDALFNDIFEAVGDKLNMLEVYSLDVALNGVDGVTFVDKLNSSTSAGNPFKKSKKHFISFDENNHIESLDPIILDRINDIEKCYSEGKRFHPQFCAHLKDEPVTHKKIASGKTRVFTGGEFAWSVVVRRYLLSHIRLIQNNPYAFEAMPGIVAQSTEWATLYKYLVHFGEDQIVAGDYGKFDKKMAAPFIISAFNILERLSKKAGWSDEDCRFIKCIAYDTAFPCIDFNGDLIEIQGNPSGHPLTVIINCLVNSLYMRYAYKLVSGKSLHTFRQNVHLATYGDDNIMGVSKDCPKFHHTRISVAMKIIGVEYTMAEKEAVSVPYINIKDASFLKRKFVFDKNIGTIVAPLDHSSIDKMLTSYLDTGVLAREAHSICVIETALREYFYYGREVYEDRLAFFTKLISDCNLQDWVRDSTLPNYKDMVYDFWMRFRDIDSAQKYTSVL